MRKLIIVGAALFIALFSWLRSGSSLSEADFCSRPVATAQGPITGQGEYNHLSVRSAAAIVLDRLLAPAR